MLSTKTVYWFLRLQKYSWRGSLTGLVTDSDVLLVFAVIFHALSHGEVEARRPWKKNTVSGTNKHGAHKLAIKTMKTEDGDVIDCVDIYKQPAFDHPALKNHTIQIKPNIYPTAFEPGKVPTSLRQQKRLQRIGKCPQGTIPLLRNQMLDTTAKGGRAVHVNSYSSNQSSPTSGHEYAVASARTGKYYGAKAVINLWNPKVEGAKEFSLSQLWVLAGGYRTSDLNSVEAGWMVHPALYGDNKTRLFIYWTNSAYKGPGCYNLKCPGFVQTSNKIALGAAVNPVSTYGGKQYELSISVIKDKSSGNWWLTVQDVHMGYWPASLFNTLAKSASVVQWEGEIINDRTQMRHTRTEMGSGHFPAEGSGKASYFKNFQVMDDSNTFKSLRPIKLVTNPKCYDIEIGAETGDKGGSSFFYGGPGLSSECR